MPILLLSLALGVSSGLVTLGIGGLQNVCSSTDALKLSLAALAISSVVSTTILLYAKQSHSNHSLLSVIFLTSLPIVFGSSAVATTCGLWLNFMTPS